MTTMTQRYKHVRAAISAYVAAKDKPLEPNHLLRESDISELIADLMHASTHYGMDTGRVLRMAHLSYADEQTKNAW